MRTWTNILPLIFILLTTLTIKAQDGHEVILKFRLLTEDSVTLTEKDLKEKGYEICAIGFGKRKHDTVYFDNKDKIFLIASYVVTGSPQWLTVIHQNDTMNIHLVLFYDLTIDPLVFKNGDFGLTWKYDKKGPPTDNTNYKWTKMSDKYKRQLDWDLSHFGYDNFIIFKKE